MLLLFLLGSALKLGEVFDMVATFEKMAYCGSFLRGMRIRRFTIVDIVVNTEPAKALLVLLHLHLNTSCRTFSPILI